MYADTDFFLAFLKPSDWLKEKAVKRYKQHKDEMVTSAATLVELIYVTRSMGLDPEQIVTNAVNVMHVRDVTAADVVLAAHYAAKNPDLGVMDCLHAACARDDVVLSSEKKAFAKLGLKQERLDE